MNITSQELRKRMIEGGIDIKLADYMIGMYELAQKSAMEAAKRGDLKMALLATGVATVPYNLAIPDTAMEKLVEEVNFLFAKNGHYSTLPKTRGEIDTAIEESQKMFLQVASTMKATDPIKFPTWLENALIEFYGFAQGTLWSTGMDRDEAQFKARHMREKLRKEATMDSFKVSNN